MKLTYKKISFLVIFFDLTLVGVAQIQRIVPQGVHATGDFKARDEVITQPETWLKPTGTNHVRLYIDKNIQAPVSYQPGGVNYTDNSIDVPIDFSLPVGTTHASYNVTGAGQAFYNIPIYIPPGTNGIQPALNIYYNNASPHGLLGRGWNLGGLSAITRVNRDIYHNITAGPIVLNANDAYALDGNRMIQTSGGSGIYRLENEFFSQITKTGQSFKVETKEGLTMEYGNTTDSKLALSQGVLSWFLSKVSDNYGNYMLYEYNNDGLGEVTLKEIKYTGNQAAGIEPYNSIKFYYDIRTDASATYLLDNLLPNTLLLREVEVFCEGVSFKRYKFKYGYNIQTFLNEIIESGSDGKKLNSILVKYGEEQSTPSNLVTSVVPSVSSNVCSGSGGSLYANADYRTGDFNGDGKSDLLGFTYNQIFSDGQREYTGWRLYINQDDGATFTEVACATITNFFPYSIFDYFSESDPQPLGMDAIDFNGDGKDDMLLGRSESGSLVFTVYYSTGSGFTPGFSYYFNQGYQFVVADVNGDTRPELISYSDGVHTNGDFFRVHFFSTSTPTTADLNSAHFYAVNGDPLISPVYRGFSPIDFDGDGVNELLTTRDGQRTVLKLNVIFVTTGPGVPLFPIVESCREKYHENFTSPYYQNYPLDFNGDRITDFVKRNLTTNNNLITYGTGSGYSPFGNLSATPSNSRHNTKWIMADINNDGISDILDLKADIINPKIHFNVTYGNQLNSRTEIGSINNVSFPRVIDYAFEPDELPYPPFNQVPEFITGDFDGDGRQDVFFKTNDNNGTRRIAYFNKASTRQLATAINDGFRKKIRFKYKTLSSGTPLYTKGTSAQYPVADFQVPLYVVSEFSMPDGTATGLSTTTYQYEEATVHLEGKGFIGFKKMIAVNPVNRIKTVSESAVNTTYFENIPFKTQTYLTTNNSLISEQTQDVSFITFGSGPTQSQRHFTKTDQSISTNHVSGVATTTDFEYDNNGNITYQKITIGNNNVENTEVRIPVYLQRGSWLPSKPESITTTVTRQGQAPYVRETKYEYDNTKGNVTKVINDPGKLKSVTMDNQYDPLAGVLTQQQGSSTDPIGIPVKTVSFEYDTKKRFVTETINSLNQHSCATYDPKWGKPLTEKTIDNLTTTYKYDGLGRNIKVTTPDNIVAKTTYAWVQSGEIIPGVDPLNVTHALYSIKTERSGSPTSKIFYDLFGHGLKTETDGLIDKVFAVKTYDARGNLFKSSGAYQLTSTLVPIITTNTYDDLNRNAQSTSVAGNVTNATVYGYIYAGGNTTITTVTPDNKTFVKTTDASGLLTAASDNGGSLTYQYFSNRQSKEIKLNDVTTNTMEYDEYGRQTKLIEPNSGTTEYEYNAYGLLFKQKDANNTTYQFTYDVLDRLTLKQQIGTSNAYNYQYVTTGNGLNMLQTITGPNGISYTNTYDNLRRTTQTQQNINGQVFTSGFEYDQFSNIKKHTYPSGFAVENIYNNKGYHTQINRADNNQPIWQLDETNALGQYSKYTLGNGLQTQMSYTDFGLPTKFKTGNIQELDFSFDPANSNLNSRKDVLRNNLTETFHYDNLNRLEDAQAGTNPLTELTYALNGNIDSKSDAGDFEYSTTKPNAICKITNYEPIVPTIEQNITYTPFKKAEHLTEGDYDLTITYGPDDERKKTDLLNTQTNAHGIRYFAGNYEKTISGNTATEVHYINCGSGLVAMYVIENGTGAMYYPHTDYLGSILKVTNQQGIVAAEQSFDAWGNYRNPTTWALLSPGEGVAGLPTWLYRGFTQHEHLPQFGVVNMNGRMYDPLVGRMLSTDNFVQAGGFTQSYNRYSYALNNPLKYSDPNGENPLLIVLGLFTVGSVLDHLLNYNNYGHESIGEAIKAGGNQGFNAYKQTTSVAQIPVYDKNGVTVSIGPSLTGLGITGGISYTNGDWSVGVGGGISQSGSSIGGGVSYYDRPNNQSFSAFYSHFGSQENFLGTQNTAGIGFSKGDFSLKLENDFFACEHQDRWRTGGFEIGIGDFVVGARIYENDPGNEGSPIDLEGRNLAGKKNRPYKGEEMGAWKNGFVYKSPLYLGYKSGNTVTAIGINHPLVQDKFQNPIHRWVGFGRQQYYNNYSQFQNQGFYSESWMSNPYSIYGY